jgi:septal ring factor EnvC (AmiA/AmiB activator)
MVLLVFLVCLVIHNKVWGISSSGRAPDLHSGGSRFDPCILHQYQIDIDIILLYYNSIMETIKKLIDKPATWMYFILVVCLLIIVSNNSGTIKDLEADLVIANADISTNDSTLEAMSNEIAVRDDAIAGLTVSAKDAIAGWESANASSVELEVRVADLESQLADAGSTLVDVRQELSDTKTLLDVCVNTQAQ